MPTVPILDCSASGGYLTQVTKTFKTKLQNKFDKLAKLHYLYNMNETKIRNSAIYYSRSNNKVVRVTRANQQEKIAYVKHHNIELANEEVFFGDLEPVTGEQVKKYLGR